MCLYSQVIKVITAYRVISIQTIFLIALSNNSLQAQKENNVWAFGNKGGINFNVTPPAILTSINLSTDEGVASISDEDGNLLFYTDGISVWDRNHDKMPNGTGLFGHISSTQSALITSAPGNCRRYYLFTTDGIENNLANGLRYSVVDLNLRNGLGDVVHKNILLHAPTTEKIIAIPNQDDKSIWVIAHAWNSSDFLIYKIDVNGVTLAKKQTIGEIHTGGVGNINGVGYMKASPAGTKIALVNRFINSLEIFDFEINTGTLSNTKKLQPKYDLAYGVEFSPDNSKLYLGTNSRIYQFDLSSDSQDDIINSEFLITTSSLTVRALQLAPNEKIYVALNNQSYLGVINNPNLTGPNSDYTEFGIDISPGISKFGLPNPSTVILSPPFIDLGSDTTLCGNATLTFDSEIPNSTYLWQDGNTNPVYTINSPGLYYVTIENSCGKSTDSINIGYRNLESVFIPNVFTPNGDQWNQSFEIDDRLLGSSVRIFNRWGRLVYESPHYMGGWEGANVSTGIYYYLIIDSCKNRYKGSLTIIH